MGSLGFVPYSHQGDPARIIGHEDLRHTCCELAVRNIATRTARESRGKTGQRFCCGPETSCGIETGCPAGTQSRSRSEISAAGHGREGPWVALQTNQTAVDGVLAKFLFP